MNAPDSLHAARAAAVDAAIDSRRSVRAFLPTTVARSTVEQILQVAARAPSGANTQPWQVHVLMGAALARFTRALHTAYLDPAERGAQQREYQYYPQEWKSPYIDRRRKIGWDLYRLLGIAKGQTQRMAEQHLRNYLFFGAPVGMVFTIDRQMERGSWLDYGMFLQNIMVAARARGLHTCPQGAFIELPATIARELALAPEQMVVCGMALGHADLAAPENALVTERAAVAEFARFLD